MAAPGIGETMIGFNIYNDKNEEIAYWDPTSKWVKKGGKLTKNIKVDFGGVDGVLYSTVNNSTEILYEAAGLPYTIGRVNVYLTVSNLNAAEATLGFHYYNGNVNTTINNITIEASDSSLLGVTENRSLDYI